MITKIRSLADLPNVAGYKFDGIGKDGTVYPLVVYKKSNGCHTCDNYSQLIGWLKTTESQTGFIS